MIVRYLIFPYKQGSEGAAALAAELQGQRILREGSKYKHRQGDLIINWGASDCPYPQALNRNNVAVLDKLAFFQRLAGTGLTPRFAINQADINFGFPIFCRTKLRGRDGAGIVVADSQNQLVACSLYVEGVDKTAEYRVHIGRLPNSETRIIGAQKKVHGQPHEGQDTRVWTGESTRFVWTVNGQPAVIPGSVTNVVRQAFDHFPELTFGAFDVVYRPGGALVLEINSAPMMTPETARRYGDFFREYVQVMPQPDAPAAPAAASTPPPPAPAPAPEPVVQVFTITVTSEDGVFAQMISNHLNELDGVTNVNTVLIL